MRRSILLLAFALGCSLDETQAPERPDSPLTELPRALSADERAVIASANDFTFALLARAAADEDGANLVLSPLSASMALGMLLNGAAGETRAELESALRLQGLSPHQINAGYRDLVALLGDLDDDVTLGVANAIWARDGVPFEQTFIDTVVGYFDATVRTLDFRDPASVDVINDWVAESTRDRIDRMIESIDDDAVMFLMNAIYFKGDWTVPFDPELTASRPFTRADGSTVQVPMMLMEETRHSVSNSGDASVVDLSYARGAWSMTLVLPPEGTSAMEYAAGLDAAAWNALVSGLDSSSVQIMLPRFTIEYERTLNDDLMALGMQRAFSDQAEFAPLTPLQVYVHEVKQKTFIAVDEVGTEAAAVTSIEVRAVSMPPYIHFDRPFVFAIRERLSGTILFAGVIGAP